MACEYINSAARSVHLWFDLPHNAPTVSNQVCVQKSQPGTYFCVIGFSGGYCGIQELCKGQKKAIFSVWDSESNTDPEVDSRARVLYHGENVDASRFGNEGTGAKTMTTFNWKIDEPITFKVTAALDESGVWTSYACYYKSDTADWFHMATLQTMNKGKLIQNVYSFIEDFRRDGNSFHEYRCAYFGNCSGEGPSGNRNCRKARFTADNSTAVNINCGRKNHLFYLETGGKVMNSDVKLNCDVTLD